MVMKHRIDKTITYMFMIGHETCCGFKVIHPRALLIDRDGQLWTRIDQYKNYHDIYARLIPEWDDVKH